LLLAAAVALTVAAHAHQQKAAVTRVLFNERSGNIEVMHRFRLHDAEHAVREIFGGDADMLSVPRTRDRFAAYVADRFELGAGGEALALDLLGSEIDGQHLWVYQETPIPATIGTLTMRHDALRDLWPAQSNLVNVQRGGEVRSLRFEGGAGVLELVLAPPD
jgi:hypothetical protein